jgi:outer membrane biosynthesis protein TonB
MYVYWWHVGRLRAVAVGRAEDPHERVRAYRRWHGGNDKNVRGYRLDGGTDAEWVERQLCRLLEARGFRPLALRPRGAEEELFALGGRTFDEAHELLRDAARHIALAEASNRRKRRIRYEAPAEEDWESPQQEEWQTTSAPDAPPPRPPPAAAPSRSGIAGRAWLYAIPAIVVAGVAAVLVDDELSPRGNSAGRPDPAVARTVQIGESSARPQPDPDGRRKEGDVLGLFDANDVARGIAALPAPPDLRPLVTKPAQPGSEQLQERNHAAVPALPSPQPHPPQAADPPLQAVPREPVLPRREQIAPSPHQQAPPAPQQAAPREPVSPRREPVAPSVQQQAAPAPAPAPVPRTPEVRDRPAQPCTVSRPKPGFQVYRVTCANSQVTIGRTVDVPTGWTVGDGVNPDEAVEFFMKSPYSR